MPFTVCFDEKSDQSLFFLHFDAEEIHQLRPSRSQLLSYLHGSNSSAMPVRNYASRIHSYWLQDASFITLLFMMGFTIFVVPTLLEQSLIRIEALHLMLLLLFTVGIWSSYTKVLRIAGIVLLSSSVLVYLGSYQSNNPELKAFLWVTYSLNTAVFIAINLQLLFRDDRFNFHRVIGAVNVYLLVALLGAFLFELLHHMFGTSIVGEVELSTPDENFSDFIYFSLVSLTTVGFGEIQPANAAARMLSVFLSTVGILYPAVVIAKLMSTISNERPPEAPNKN